VHDTLHAATTRGLRRVLWSGVVGFLIAVKEAGHARNGQREEHAMQQTTTRLRELTVRCAGLTVQRMSQLETSCDESRERRSRSRESDPLAVRLGGSGERRVQMDREGEALDARWDLRWD
jgi:hypothetical protein